MERDAGLCKLLHVTVDFRLAMHAQEVLGEAVVDMQLSRRDDLPNR